MEWATLMYERGDNIHVLYFNPDILRDALQNGSNKTDVTCLYMMTGYYQIPDKYDNTAQGDEVIAIEILHPENTIKSVKLYRVSSSGKFRMERLLYDSRCNHLIPMIHYEHDGSLSIIIGDKLVDMHNKHTGANTLMRDNHTPADTKDISRSGSTWNEINYMSEGRLNKVYFRLRLSTLPSLKNIHVDIYGYYSIPEVINLSQEPAHDCNIHIIVDGAGTIARIWVDDELIYSYDYNKIEISLGTSGIAFNVVRNHIDTNQTINPIHGDHDCHKTDNGLATLLYHINAGIPISLSRIIELCSSTISPLSDWIWTSLQISIKDILSKGMHFNAKQQFVMIYEKLDDNGVDNIIRFIPVDNFDFDGDILNIIPIK